VEDEESRTAADGRQCPGQGDLLPLTSREVLPAVVGRGENRVPAVGKLLQEVGGTGVRERPLQGRYVRCRREVAEADVLAQRQLVAHEVLEDDTDRRAAVENDPALVRRVQAA